MYMVTITWRPARWLVQVSVSPNRARTPRGSYYCPGLPGAGLTQQRSQESKAKMSAGVVPSQAVEEVPLGLSLSLQSPGAPWLCRFRKKKHNVRAVS